MMLEDTIETRDGRIRIMSTLRADPDAQDSYGQHASDSNAHGVAHLAGRQHEPSRAGNCGSIYMKCDTL